MSRSQYVGYRDQGFWAYDVSLAIFLKHLVDVADRQLAVGNVGWLREAVDWWRVVASINDYGFEIEESWSADQVKLFLQLADEAVAVISRRPAFTADEVAGWSLLDDMHLETRGEPIVAIRPIVTLGRAVIHLVDGSLPPSPPGTWWLFGTGKEGDVIRQRDADRG